MNGLPLSAVFYVIASFVKFFVAYSFKFYPFCNLLERRLLFYWQLRSNISNISFIQNGESRLLEILRWLISCLIPWHPVRNCKEVILGNQSKPVVIAETKFRLLRLRFRCFHFSSELNTSFRRPIIMISVATANLITYVIITFFRPREICNLLEIQKRLLQVSYSFDLPSTGFS